MKRNNFNLYAIVNIDGKYNSVIGSVNMERLMKDAGNRGRCIKIRSFDSFVEMIQHEYMTNDNQMTELLKNYRGYADLEDVTVLLHWAGEEDMLDKTIKWFGFDTGDGKIHTNKPAPEDDSSDKEDDNPIIYTIEQAFTKLSEMLNAKGYQTIVDWIITPTLSIKADNLSDEYINSLQMINLCSFTTLYLNIINICGYIRLSTIFRNKYDRMDPDIMDKLIKWVDSLPDTSGKNNATSELTMNNLFCLQNKLLKKGYNASLTTTDKTVNLEIDATDMDYKYKDSFAANIVSIKPLYCATSIANNWIIISYNVDKDIDMEFYKALSSWVYELPNLYRSAELAKKMKQFCTKDSDPDEIAKTASEALSIKKCFGILAGKLNDKGYKVYVANQGISPYYLSINYEKMKAESAAVLVCMDLPANYKITIRREPKILTIYAYESPEKCIDLNLYRELAHWVNHLPKAKK